MVLKTVQSSNIRKIGYDPVAKKLVVLFRNGNMYSYTPVEPDMYEELMAAKSIGGYFYNNIRDNKEISYEQIEN